MEHKLNIYKYPKKDAHETLFCIDGETTNKMKQKRVLKVSNCYIKHKSLLYKGYK